MFCKELELHFLIAVQILSIVDVGLTLNSVGVYCGLRVAVGDGVSVQVGGNCISGVEVGNGRIVSIGLAAIVAAAALDIVAFCCSLDN